MKTANIDMAIVEQKANEKFWTLTTLAIKAGLSPATVFSLKSGRRRGTWATLNKLAAALGVKPAEIIKEQE